MKRNLLTIIVGAVLVAIFVLLLFVFQVRQSEVAVITTFGKPSKAYDTPGAHFKLPWPIQKVYKFDSRVQNFQDKFSENLTADQINLLTSVYVGWKISDGSQFLKVFRGGSVSAAQQQLENMLRSAKNAVIGRHQLSEFVNSDPKQLKFEEIETEIEKNVQTQLTTNNVGMELVFLGFKKIGLPESVTQTVFDRMKSERQNLIAQNQSQGEGEAMKIKSTAERQAAEMLSKANADAIQIRAAGEREAASTYPVFQQNPELANFLLRIDALQKSLNQKSTLIFDERTPPFDLFSHLPTNAPAK
ncbi:MAG TPA: protease modulator HflC [Verrucomicrobiae bacterium]|nr:protease modulator HflC [Verrucomicrobiae bacterium]